MSANDFWLLDENGLPYAFIDSSEMVETSRRIIDRLLAVAEDSDKVAQELCDQIMAFPGSEATRLLLATTVIDNLISGVLAPIISNTPSVRDSITDHLIQRRGSRPDDDRAAAPEGDLHV